MFILFVILSVYFSPATASHFYVNNNGTTNTCLIVDGDFVFNLKFENDTQLYTTSLNETLEFGGDCHLVWKNQSIQTLNISFLPGKPSARYTKPWELSLVFGSSSSEAFKIIDYTLKTQKTEEIPKFAEFHMNEKDSGDVIATGNNAYKCSTAKLGLEGESSIELKGANVIAFANLNSTTFAHDQVYEVCYLDSRTSEVVPIVVGACLAALVVVVLVAYLIGRARARRQGYASV